MVLSGFPGSDRILTADELAARVGAGEVRYYVLGGDAGGGETDLAGGGRSHGTLVDPFLWGGTGRGYTLYDCRGLQVG